MLKFKMTSQGENVSNLKVWIATCHGYNTPDRTNYIIWVNQTFVYTVWKLNSFRTISNKWLSISNYHLHFPIIKHTFVYFNISLHKIISDLFLAKLKNYPKTILSLMVICNNYKWTTVFVGRQQFSYTHISEILATKCTTFLLFLNRSKSS